MKPEKLKVFIIYPLKREKDEDPASEELMEKAFDNWTKENDEKIEIIDRQFAEVPEFMRGTTSKSSYLRLAVFYREK